MKKRYGRKLDLVPERPKQSSTYDVFRTHRFFVKPSRIAPDTKDPEEWAEEAFYLTLKAVRFEPPAYKDDLRRVILEHYVHDDNIDLLLAAKYPEDLTIVLLDGAGKNRAKINLTEVKFVRNRHEKLNLDYANSDIMTLEAELTYAFSNMVAP